MSEAIVVLNAGSSSLKFSVYEVANSSLALVARGQVEGLGSVPRMKVKDGHGQLLADVSPDAGGKRFGHSEAFAYLVNWFRQRSHGPLNMLGVGHRVAHGGLEFVQPTLLNADVMARLEKLTPLVPLHQPHNLAMIKIVTEHRPEVPQVACFDTAFHQGPARPRVTQRFGLPDAMFQRGLRRWGFHGLSYESIAGTFRQIAPELAKGRVIAAHLGNGASLCAMRDGQCVDTTMSFSSLDGLPMGTRCGSLDPGAVIFLLRYGLSLDDVESLLYKQSGLLGISGVSNDLRELLASKDPLAAEAIDYFVYRIVREIASLTAALGGLNALIFTAGIGENSPLIRQRACEQLGWLGLGIDPDANEGGQGPRMISPPDHSPSVWVIPTDEEEVIARHTLEVVREAVVSSGK